MAIPLSSPLNQFPPYPPQIDWRNPLTRNLGRVITPSAGMVDVVTRQISIVNGTIARQPAGFRAGSVTSASSIELLDFPANTYTCFAIAVAQAAGTNSARSLISRSTSSNLDNYYLYYNGGNIPTIRHFQAANGIERVVSGITIPIGSVASMAGTYDGGTIRIYVNGQFYNSLSATAPYVSGAGYVTQLLATGGTGRALNYIGNGLLLAAIWNRALTASEVVEVSKNPWQLFSSQNQRLSIFSPVYQPGSDITVTGWTGSPDNVNLYANIDESTASDADYVLSPSLSGTPGPAIFGLSPSSLAAGNYTVNVRARRTGSVGQLRALLVDSSGTTVGTSSWQSLTTTYTTYNLSITTTGTAARLRFEVQE